MGVTIQLFSTSANEEKIFFCAEIPDDAFVLTNLPVLISRPRLIFAV